MITLKGKTLKGKNRIREHGNRWVVVTPADPFHKDKILIHPEGNSLELRWIHPVNDKDFEVISFI